MTCNCSKFGNAVQSTKRGWSKVYTCMDCGIGKTYVASMGGIKIVKEGEEF